MHVLCINKIGPDKSDHNCKMPKIDANTQGVWQKKTGETKN